MGVVVNVSYRGRVLGKGVPANPGCGAASRDGDATSDRDRR